MTALDILKSPTFENIRPGLQNTLHQIMFACLSIHIRVYLKSVASVVSCWSCVSICVFACIICVLICVWML